MPKERKRGRPPKKMVDWREFDKLCAMHCTQEEIYCWFDMDDKTLTARCKEEYGMPFSELFRIKRSKGKVSLRRSQMQNALAGGTAMQIFLGKNYLGQSDRPEEKEEIDKEVFLRKLSKLLPG